MGERPPPRHAPEEAVNSPRRYKISYYTSPERRPEQRVVFYSDAETPALAFEHLAQTEREDRIHGAFLQNVHPDEWLDR